MLILETKEYDPLKEIKSAAAERWCAAVNAHGGDGSWAYRVAEKPEEGRVGFSRHTAAGPRSPLLMRTASTTSVT